MFNFVQCARIKRRWRNSTTCMISYIMCKERNEKLSHYELHLPRLVGILTGHCLATTHAVKLGIADNGNYRKCDESEAIETLEHLICKCPALSLARLRYLGAPVLVSLEDASKRTPGKLLAFAKNT